MVKKEKNFVIFSTDDGRVAKYDINTGIMYGTSGKSVKYIPTYIKPLLEQYSVEKNTFIHLLLILMLKNSNDFLESNNIKKSVQILDKINSIFISRKEEEKFAELMYYSNTVNLYQYEEISQDIEFLQFCIKNKLGIDESNFNEYIVAKDLAKYKDLEDYDYLIAIYKRCKDIKYLDFIIKHIINNNHYSNFFTKKTPFIVGFSIMNGLDLLIEYYKLSKKLNREWDKHNILIDYVRLWELNIIEEKIKDMKYFNTHVNKELLSYEYGDFIVTAPTCGEDLITEGRKMHHCVGSYADAVRQGRCAIVFIRNKNKINVPYITCEITRSGIGQYYLAYDKRITSNEDWDFYNHYKEYVKERIEDIKKMLDTKVGE